MKLTQLAVLVVVTGCCLAAPPRPRKGRTMVPTGEPPRLSYPTAFQGASASLGPSPSPAPEAQKLLSPHESQSMWRHIKHKNKAALGVRSVGKTAAGTFLIPSYQSINHGVHVGHGVHGSTSPGLLTSAVLAPRDPQLRPQVHEEGIELSDHVEYPPTDGKYEFVYRVQDKSKPHHEGSDYGHSEARDGKRTWGRYYVKLPDGRLQTVRYWADHSGYHAEVLFTGKAHHPKLFKQYAVGGGLGDAVSHSSGGLGGNTRYGGHGAREAEEFALQVKHLVPTYQALASSPAVEEQRGSESKDMSTEIQQQHVQEIHPVQRMHPREHHEHHAEQRVMENQETMDHAEDAEPMGPEDRDMEEEDPEERSLDQQEMPEEQEEVME